MKAADFYLLCGSKHEAATCYIDAANCHRKTSAAGAVQCLSKAVAFYAEEGRWSMAARQQKEIAEIYEKELDLDNAIEAYGTAYHRWFFALHVAHPLLAQLPEGGRLLRGREQRAERQSVPPAGGSLLGTEGEV